MKANEFIHWNQIQDSQPTAAFGLCRKALALVAQIKTAMLAEHEDRETDCKHLVQLALNEAEALAWQTDYPHLFFPSLAAEKVQALGNWHVRQRLVHEASHQVALAA
jgi:hypothetical protein